MISLYKALSTQRRAEWILLLATAIWGTSFVAVQDAIVELPTLSLVTWRFGIAACLLLPTLCRNRPSWQTFGWGTVLGILLLAGFALQATALLHTTAARAAFGTSLSTVLVPLAAYALWRAPWPTGTYLALLSSLAGAFTLAQGGAQGTQARLGDLLSLLCAVAFTCHILLQARLARRLEPWGLLGVQVLVCALGALALATASPARLVIPTQLMSWATLVYLGVFTTTFCLWAQLYAQTHTTATRTAFILALEPVFAAGFAWAMRAQSLDRTEIFGGFLLVLAAILAERALPRTLSLSVRRFWQRRTETAE